jgi:hypothetical protein
MLANVLLTNIAGRHFDIGVMVVGLCLDHVADLASTNGTDQTSSFVM